MGKAILMFTRCCFRYVKEAEAVVMVFSSSAMGIAVSKGRPSQNKRGV